MKLGVYNLGFHNPLSFTRTFIHEEFAQLVVTCNPLRFELVVSNLVLDPSQVRLWCTRNMGNIISKEQPEETWPQSYVYCYQCSETFFLVVTMQFIDLLYTLGAHILCLLHTIAHNPPQPGFSNPKLQMQLFVRSHLRNNSLVMGRLISFKPMCA